MAIVVENRKTNSDKFFTRKILAILGGCLILFLIVLFFYNSTYNSKLSFIKIFQNELKGSFVYLAQISSDFIHLFLDHSSEEQDQDFNDSKLKSSDTILIFSSISKFVSKGLDNFKKELKAQSNSYSENFILQNPKSYLLISGATNGLTDFFRGIFYKNNLLRFKLKSSILNICNLNLFSKFNLHFIESLKNKTGKFQEAFKSNINKKFIKIAKLVQESDQKIFSSIKFLGQKD